MLITGDSPAKFLSGHNLVPMAALFTPNIK